MDHDEDWQENQKNDHLVPATASKGTYKGFVRKKSFESFWNPYPELGSDFCASCCCVFCPGWCIEHYSCIVLHFTDILLLPLRLDFCYYASPFSRHLDVFKKALFIGCFVFIAKNAGFTFTWFTSCLWDVRIVVNGAFLEAPAVSMEGDAFSTPSPCYRVEKSLWAVLKL